MMDENENEENKVDSPGENVYNPEEHVENENIAQQPENIENNNEHKDDGITATEENTENNNEKHEENNESEESQITTGISSITVETDTVTTEIDSYNNNQVENADVVESEAQNTAIGSENPAQDGAEVSNADPTNLHIDVTVNITATEETTETEQPEEPQIHNAVETTSVNDNDSQSLSDLTPKKVILVEVTKDDIQRNLSVEIVDDTFKKPFLGGFRHKLTNTEYLNAACQTLPKKIPPSEVERFNRDTQTVISRNQIQQTYSDTSTQMTKPGCYVTDVTDVFRYPGTYVTADEVEELRLSKVIILQSYWRRWLATRFVDRLRHDRDARIEWERQEAEAKAAERAQRLQKEFERRMKPRTKADFDLLYAALERWRREETDRINEMHSGAERKAALIGLLEQEQYLIQSIERHRLNADTLNASDNVKAFLDKAASPKFWRAYDGRKTYMNTMYTLRAQELRDLYDSLQMTYLTQDERLDVLLTLKHTVKEYDCKLTQELMELIEREADLLTRGMKVENLEGLRQRINTLYLQFCKTPEFNPEVARLLKVPRDASKLRKDIYFCPSCNAYLPSTEFPLASNSRIVGRCKKCSDLDNNARLRHDFTKIRCIMQHLRRTEEQFDDDSKIAFVIQDADLRYLIENIWNSQSALSGEDELYELVFVRWNKHEQWSPWNCVFLTKEEASAHMKLDNVVGAYGRIFIGKVHHRHVLAKQYFSKLSKVSNLTQTKPKNMMTPHQKSAATVTV